MSPPSCSTIRPRAGRLSTGPYKIVDWTPQQELIDLRAGLVGCQVRLCRTARDQRIIVVPRTDDTGMAQGSDQQRPRLQPRPAATLDEDGAR